MTCSSRIPLNGFDTFMLALDDTMRARGASGNSCHLLLRFPIGTDVSALAEQAGSCMTACTLASLRVITPLLRPPRWHECEQTELPSVVQTSSARTFEEVEALVLQNSQDPRIAPPVGIVALPALSPEPGILFYWHHSLCDAKGGEMLVQMLGADDSTAPLSLDSIFLRSSRHPLREAIPQALNATKDIFVKLAQPLVRLSSDSVARPSPTYRKIHFSKEETAAIDTRSQEITNGIFPMALYLAASSRAASAIFETNAPAGASLCITVPHDMRRTLRSKAPLGNQVSSLFFRVAAGTNTTHSLRETTNEIIAQLHDALASDRHKGVRSFFEVTKWLPLHLFWKLIERPGHGHPASMYFSDIGSSLSTLTHFRGTPISYATHYPPNLYAPGFTAVWSRYRGLLEVTICYDTGLVLPDRYRLFEENLMRELLVPACQ